MGEVFLVCLNRICRSRPGSCGDRLFVRGLKGTRIEFRQEITRLDVLTFGESDLYQLAIDPLLDRNRVERLHRDQTGEVDWHIPPRLPTPELPARAPVPSSQQRWLSHNVAVRHSRPTRPPRLLCRQAGTSAAGGSEVLGRF